MQMKALNMVESEVGRSQFLVFLVLSREMHSRLYMERPTLSKPTPQEIPRQLFGKHRPFRDVVQHPPRAFRI